MLGTRASVNILKSIFIIPILYFFVLLIIRPLLLLTLLPFGIYRYVVSFLGPRLNKGLSRAVSPQSIILASDDVHTSPKWNLVVLLLLQLNDNEINFDINFIRDLFQKEFERTNSNGSLKYPELRQYFTMWLGYLFWKWDSTYSFKNHYSVHDSTNTVMKNDSAKKRIENYREMDEKTLFEMTEELIWKPFLKNQSPWEIITIPNYKQDQTFDSNCLRKTKIPVIVRFHHGIADGYALNNLIVRALTNSRSVISVIPTLSKPANSRNENLKEKKGKNGARKYIESVTNIAKFTFVSPYDSLKLGVFPRKEKNKWFPTDNKLGRRFYFGKTKMGIPLSMIKDVKRSLNVSFTAVLLGAITAGIRKAFLKEIEEEGGKVEMKCAFALPFSSADNTLGNHVTACQVRLPLEIGDSEARLQEMDKLLRRIVTSTAPLKAYFYTKFIGLLPARWSRKIATNLLPTIWFSNFPGPSNEIKMDFGELTDVFFAGGLGHGNTGIGIGVISQYGMLKFLFGIDRFLTENENLSNEIVQHVEDEIAHLWSLNKITY